MKYNRNLESIPSQALKLLKVIKKLFGNQLIRFIFMVP